MPNIQKPQDLYYPVLQFKTTKAVFSAETSKNCMLAAAQKVIYAVAAFFVALGEPIFLALANVVIYGRNHIFANKKIEKAEDKKDSSTQPDSIESKTNNNTVGSTTALDLPLFSTTHGPFLDLISKPGKEPKARIRFIETLLDAPEEKERIVSEAPQSVKTALEPQKTLETPVAHLLIDGLLADNEKISSVYFYVAAQKYMESFFKQMLMGQPKAFPMRALAEMYMKELSTAKEKSDAVPAAPTRITRVFEPARLSDEVKARSNEGKALTKAMPNLSLSKIFKVAE